MSALVKQFAPAVSLTLDCSSQHQVQCCQIHIFFICCGHLTPDVTDDLALTAAPLKMHKRPSGVILVPLQHIWLTLDCLSCAWRPQGAYRSSNIRLSKHSSLCQVLKATLDESAYAKKKAKLESKAALYPRATFIAICSLRQVPALVHLQHAHALQQRLKTWC